VSENVLHLENVTMQFGGVVAVNDVCMDVYEGEIVALIGPNGAGKTTVFNVITGVYAPTNGRVTLRGKVIAENHPHGRMKKLYAAGHHYEYPRSISHTPDRITKLGMARTFQNIRLFKSMTVFDNVLVAKHMNMKAGFFSAVLHLNGREESRMREETLELLRIVGLEAVKDEIATSLPYGQQRRLEIARALSTKPDTLLLDEPAAGMNPQETEDLSAFIREIKDRFGLTVFLIEHDMNLVMDISDRIYVLNFGKRIADGTPAEIQSNPDVITAYLGVAEE
jgi:branched-chain amino acid transport system ATP-binding protein